MGPFSNAADVKPSVDTGTVSLSRVIVKSAPDGLDPTAARTCVRRRCCSAAETEPQTADGRLAVRRLIEGVNQLLHLILLLLAVSLAPSLSLPCRCVRERKSSGGQRESEVHQVSESFTLKTGSNTSWWQTDRKTTADVLLRTNSPPFKERVGAGPPLPLRDEQRAGDGK